MIIKCKTCFWRWIYEGDDWCKIIELPHGGSCKADRTECDLYRKKGTEPKWLCCKCGKNVWGESATGEGGRWYCTDCFWKREHKKSETEKRIKYQKIAEEIIKLLKNNL